MRRLPLPLVLALLLAAAPAAAQDPAPAGEPPASPAAAPPGDAAPPEDDGEAPARPRTLPKLSEDERTAAEQVMERMSEGLGPSKIREAAHHYLSPEAIGPEDSDPALRRAAGRFFLALKRGDAAAVADLCRAPFRLESEPLATDAEVKKRLGKLLESRPLAALPLYGVEVFPAAAAIARHGAPPARLGELELKDAWVAIGNVGGSAVVAVFQRDGRGWRAVALTD